MSNKGSHLKSPAHICRKCLIAFRKVLQWVTSASKSFSHPAANYVSSGAKCHTTLLFFSTIPSSCENLHKHVSLDSSNALRDQNVSVYNFNKPYHSTPRPTISTKANVTANSARPPAHRNHNAYSYGAADSDRCVKIYIKVWFNFRL